MSENPVDYNLTSEESMPTLPGPLRDRDITLPQWRILTQSLFQGCARESVLMAWDYCQARRLDIFKRPVYIVPMWSQDAGRMIDTIWPGIAELRTTAMRTGRYAGKDRVEFGPDIEVELDGQKYTVPEYAQMTVYRMVDETTTLGGDLNRDGRLRVAFEGDPVYWLETYATRKRHSQEPNAMWKRRKRGQIAKCAEAAALRQAFPEELGGIYSAEEMEGQVIEGEATVEQETSAERTVDQAEAATTTETVKAKLGEFTEHKPIEVPDEGAGPDVP